MSIHASGSVPITPDYHSAVRSIDRFWSVTWSTHYRNTYSPKKCLLLLCLTWCVVNTIWLPAFIYDRVANEYAPGDCYWDPLRNRYLVRLGDVVELKRSRGAIFYQHVIDLPSFFIAIVSEQVHNPAPMSCLILLHTCCNVDVSR